MDYDEIRRTTIIAMFADDEIMEQVVLKGGNALNLVYRVGSRSSLDLDFSIETDFPDADDAKNRIFGALRSRFDSAGFLVFDESFNPKPPPDGPRQSKSGGYQIHFKIIAKEKADRLGRNLEAMRRDSLAIGPGFLRTFTIDISGHESCSGKQRHELGNYTIYVYTPPMIAIEKLRAICQQMPEYPQRGRKSARARDFYDIETIAECFSIDFGSPETHELVRSIFAAKEVPLDFIGRIPSQREFHRPDWPSVQEMIPREAAARGFDHYVDRLVGRLSLLESLWKM